MHLNIELNETVTIIKLEFGDRSAQVEEMIQFEKVAIYFCYVM
jgi:hypothetical protein